MKTNDANLLSVTIRANATLFGTKYYVDTPMRVSDNFAHHLVSIGDAYFTCADCGNETHPDHMTGDRCDVCDRARDANLSE